MLYGCATRPRNTPPLPPADASNGINLPWSPPKLYFDCRARIDQHRSPTPPVPLMIDQVVTAPRPAHIASSTAAGSPAYQNPEMPSLASNVVPLRAFHPASF